MIISDWLNAIDKDFDKGVSLFEENGGSAVVLRLLHQGCNSFTSTLLEEELAKLIKSTGAETAIVEKHTSSTSQSHFDTFENDSEKKSNSKEVDKSTPTLLQPLIKERQQLYRERDYMKVKLPHVRGESKSLYAIRIVNNTYRIDDLWNAIDHFNNTGILIHPDDKNKKDARDMFKVEREINNARSNISKHRKAGKQDLLLKWEKTLKELEDEKNRIINAV